MTTKIRQIVLKLILIFYYSFAFFYDTPKLIFVCPTESQGETLFWKVTIPFVNFKTQLNHQYLSLSFNWSLKNASRTTQIILHEVKSESPSYRKTHFKLGFSNWYLESFKVSVSLMLQLSS